MKMEFWNDLNLIKYICHDGISHWGLFGRPDFCH